MHCLPRSPEGSACEAGDTAPLARSTSDGPQGAARLPGDAWAFCQRGVYLPRLRYSAKSVHGRQFTTLPFSTHARRAWETPNLAKLRDLSSWASVSMVIFTPAFTASRA